jgi:RNA polymerase sigma-70 factor (ECF subfamily)
MIVYHEEIGKPRRAFTPLRATTGPQDFPRGGNHPLAMAKTTPTADCRRASAIDWSSVLPEHQSWLRAVVLARIGEPQAVEEVMQEIALAAVAGRDSLSNPAKVGPWLYQIAVRQALLYRRRQGRRRKLVDQYAQRCRPTEEDGRQPDPLGWLVVDERDGLIRTGLARLPRRDIEILLLKYLEGWSYRQLAEQMGISPSAVEARLHRARQRLRRELTQLEVIEV